MSCWNKVKVNRALLLMNTFIKIMKKREHHFELTDRKAV